MAGAIDAVTMPKWGLAMTEGRVVAWRRAEGEAIAAGAELVEIETSKITNVYEAPVSGVLRRCVARVGETLPVGGLIAVIAEAGVAESEVDAFVAEFNARRAAAAPARAEATPAAPQTLPAGGRRIRYLRMGAGAPVVLVHGFGGDLGSWLLTQPVLAERFEVLAPDLPGHGGSTKEAGDGSLDFLASALADLLEALEMRRVHLVGHSLGGAVALKLALQRAELARSLTLIAPLGLGPEIDAGYIDGFIQANRNRQLRPLVERLFANPAMVGRKMVDEILDYKRLDGVAQALKTIAGAVCNDGRQAVALRPRLAEIVVPVQVIWGEADRIIPAAHARDLPPSVAVHLMAGAGHMVQMEKAIEVNRIIERFIGNVATQP